MFDPSRKRLIVKSSEVFTGRQWLEIRARIPSQYRLKIRARIPSQYRLKIRARIPSQYRLKIRFCTINLSYRDWLVVRLL